jgi:NAD(P)-dependent dehydrogenase (short-subunit alcohol dehydrogenase family)
LNNNAGILVPSPQPPLAVPIDLVRGHLKVNALGAWRVSQAFAPGMAQRGWRRIVMASSGTGAFGNGLQHGLSAYAVSKESLNALTVMLAAELAGTGVLVNAVNPGLVRTRMRQDAPRTARPAAFSAVTDASNGEPRTPISAPAWWPGRAIVVPCRTFGGVRARVPGRKPCLCPAVDADSMFRIKIGIIISRI